MATMPSPRRTSTEPAAHELRSLQLALGIYVLVFGAKLAAYWMTGVMALLAEALHTLSDIFISAFLLVAVWYSARQADETHMFGYGRAQNVAAVVAATLFVSFTSLELYREAIPRLLQPQQPAYENLTLAIGVIVASMLLAAIPLFRLLVQKTRGAAARAQLIELFNDELGLIAALAGTLLIAWGFPIADPIAAIVVATIIAVNAVGLFRDNVSLLLGRSPGPDFLGEVERAARSVPGVLAVRDLRAEFVGPETVHAGLRIAVAPGLKIEEATRIVAEVHRRVHRDSHAGFCFVELEAAPAAQSAASETAVAAAAGRP